MASSGSTCMHRTNSNVVVKSIYIQINGQVMDLSDERTETQTPNQKKSDGYV